MAEMVTLKITWKDRDDPHVIRGNLETRITDEVLHVYEYSGVTSSLIGEWHFPLFSIRVYEKERR